MGSSLELAPHSRTEGVSRRLEGVDWDFNGETVRSGIHGLHPYPARFIPQLPGTLMDLLHPGDERVILDPFCGCGTTLVEAQHRGIDSVGIDLHPLATLISRVKTHPLRVDLISLGKDIVEKARASESTVPAIPRLDHWFQKDVQKAVAGLIAQLDQVEPLTVREALQVSLSRILVRVSNQESDTRYAAIEKDVSVESVYGGFLDATALVDEALREATRKAILADATVITGNVLEVTPEDIGDRPVGLVVTSPPYPNAYEYWLYHKYRMYWLGMDPISVRSQEIGARPHYFKKDPQTEEDFERQMSTCFRLFREVLSPDGLVCFVVGRSIIHGRRIDNVQLLVRAADPVGFVPIGHATRSIPRSRKTFNPDHGSIEEERIVVFARAEKE